jgi:hypothetical protein
VALIAYCPSTSHTTSDSNPWHGVSQATLKRRYRIKDKTSSSLNKSFKKNKESNKFKWPTNQKPKILKEKKGEVKRKKEKKGHNEPSKMN